MFGMPPELSPMGFDPSMFALSVFFLLGMAAGIVGALVLGIVTLPLFFLLIFAVEFVLGRLSESGFLSVKVLLLLFRGLRRNPLRTSLTYLALFILTLVLTLVYTIIAYIGQATREKEANFKVIMTEKYSLPSRMPPGYEQRLNAAIAQMPAELRPVNGTDDVITWSFIGGTTDPSNPKPENALYMFCVDPRKITLMMDGLEKKDLTDGDYAELQENIRKMREDFKRVIISKSRLKKMNLQVGQKMKLISSNYRDLVFEFEIVGTLPDGKYEGLGFCNRTYLDAMIKSYAGDHKGELHPMANKCVALIWIRVPNRASYEQLAAAVSDTAKFSGPAVKMETASSGIGAFMEAYKDIFFAMKYILAPAMVAIMSLVIANAIGISVRERRTEMAVLKVLGFQPRHVMGMVLGEALLVGFIAGGMSTLFAWAVLGSLQFQLDFLGAFIVPSEVLVLGPLLGTAVAFVGSIGPSLAAKNVRVAEVFARQT